MTQARHIFDDARPFKIDGVYCKLIALTRGQFAIVDADNYEHLNTRRWYAKWDSKLRSYYAARESTLRHDGENGSTIFMHREILGLSPTDRIRVDHFNHCGLDNREKNIRPATPRQNSQNRRCNSNNVLGMKGVSFWIPPGKTKGKYRARICVDNKSIWLGYFETPEAAYAAYCEAADRFFGEFALAQSHQSAYADGSTRFVKAQSQSHILTERQVREELERAIAEAGGVNALARASGISAEPIIRARKLDGAIRPVVLMILNLRRCETTYERVARTNGTGKL